MPAVPNHSTPPASAVAPADSRTRVAIVGAGTIGVGWAVALARGGCEISLHDSDPARLETALAEARTILVRLDANGLLEETPEAIASRLDARRDLIDALDGAAHVQECGPEDRAAKIALLARLGEAADAASTIASSSSGMPISQVAGGLQGRSRMLVAHPANPPYLLPVVEIVAAPFTRPSAVAQVRSLLEQAGLSPVCLTRELEGFALNRLQGAVLREAYCLLRDGILGVDEIDRLVRDGLGRRWALIGPFETSDLNTRGGLTRHAEVMGPAYERMGAERGQADRWTPELVSEATRQRRELLPLERWEERVRWRDEALMRLERARREVERLDGVPPR